MIKKSYKKPEIVFEHMEFNTAIASTCEWQAITDCQDAVPGDEYFQGNFLMPDDSGPGTLQLFDQNSCAISYNCYHVPLLNESVVITLS